MGDGAGSGVARPEPELLGILRIDAVERAHQRRWFTDLRSGGEADAKAVDHRVADTAAGEIVARLAGGALVGSEHLRIEARGALADRDALLALLRLLGRARISRGPLHAGRHGEPLNGGHDEDRNSGLEGKGVFVGER